MQFLINPRTENSLLTSGIIKEEGNTLGICPVDLKIRILGFSYDSVDMEIEKNSASDLKTNKHRNT